MIVELKPETERMVQEEISRGNFHSVEELIIQGLTARRKTHLASDLETKPIKKIYDLLSQPPFAGSGLQIERQREFPKLLDL